MRVIESVQIIGSQHLFQVGGRDAIWRPAKIGDIIEENGSFLCFDENDNLLVEIRNCPVVVRYREESEGN